MKTLKIKIFEFEELEEKARQKALVEFADFNIIDDWFTFNLESFSELGKLLGLTIPVKDIYFRGFYSQGDGSAFNAAVDLPELLKAIKSEEWKKEFPNTGLELNLPDVDSRVIKLILTCKIDLIATVEKSRGFYAVDACITDELPQRRTRYLHLEAELDKLAKWLQDFAELFNRFLYKSLESEYDYLTTEAAIIESIKANDYYFTADGQSANRLQRLAQPGK